MQFYFKLELGGNVLSIFGGSSKVFQSLGRKNRILFYHELMRVDGKVKVALVASRVLW